MKKFAYIFTAMLVSAGAFALNESAKADAGQQAAEASVDNPVDMTEFIVNPNFDGILFDGWLGSGFGAGGTQAEAAERYNMNYDTYQVIEGLPNGIYMVSVNGLYRAGTIANDSNTKDDETKRLAKLYAESDGSTYTTNLPSLSSGATEELNGSVISGNLYVPNSMADFVRWEEAGFYNNVSVLVPVENNTLKIGVRKDELIASDWTIVDTWTLTYYGEGFDAYKMMFDKVCQEAERKLQNALKTAVSYDNVSYQNYLNVLASAASASTANELKAYSEQINELTEKVLTSIPAYSKLQIEYRAMLDYFDAQKSVQGLMELLGNAIMPGGGSADLAVLFDALKAYPGSEMINAFSIAPLELLEDGTMSTEEVTAYTKNLMLLYQFCMANSVEDGVDCTDMLVNPDFANGFEGWTKPGAGNVGNFANLTPALPNNVEVYNNKVDIYQVVKNVKPGIYSISCNVFERPAANGSYNGSEPSKVCLYMNDFKVPVQNICKDAVKEEDAMDGVNCYVTRTYNSSPGFDLLDYMTQYGYVPNGMLGAAVAFKAGRYKQKVYGIVEEGKDMTIGLTSNGNTAHWVLWANFRLTYEGMSDDAVNVLGETYIENAEEYLNINGDKITSVQVEAIFDVIDAIKDAKTTQAKYDAIIVLNRILNEDAPANAKALEEVLAALDRLGYALDEFSATATDEAFETAYTLQDVEYVDMTTAELLQFVEEINAAITALKIPDGEASDDNPLDYTPMIENANVDKGATVGWLFTKNGGNGPALNGGIAGTPSIEFWTGDAKNLRFDVWQKIVLPAGTFELSADAANSLDGIESNGESGRAYLYAVADGAAASVPVEVVEERCTDAYSNYSLIFTLPKKTEVTLGFKSVGTMEARWFVCDNFKLLYYGMDSSKTDSPNNGTVGIAGVNSTANTAAVYSLFGTKLRTLQKGINIMRLPDGRTRKIRVK